MPHPHSVITHIVREEVQNGLKELKDELLHELATAIHKQDPVPGLGQSSVRSHEPLVDVEAPAVIEDADKQVDPDIRLNSSNEVGTKDVHFGTEVLSRIEKIELVCTEHAEKINEVFSKLDEVMQALGTTDPVTTNCEQVGKQLSVRTLTQEDVFDFEVVESIARRGMSDPLSESFWEVGMVCGLCSQTWIEIAVALFLLILIIVINGIICVIMLREFGQNDTDVDAAHAWRLDVGHWYVNAAVDGQSMVHQMCTKDRSLPASASQKQQFENAKQYHTNLLSEAPMGMFLCCWCVLIFFFLIWDEVQKSLVRMSTVLHLERAAHSHVVPVKDDEFVISKFSFSRVVANILLCVLRVGVACIFLYSGSLWLVYTEDAESLILNAVALVFVLDIDELVYRIACPSSIKALLETIKPLKKPSVGPMHFPLRASGTICGSICVLTLVGTLRLRPFAAQVKELRDAFCGGNQNFMAGMNAATGVVYTYSRQEAPQANRSSLMKTVVKEMRDNIYKPNHITAMTLQDFKADIASSLADNVARFGIKCADIQPDLPGSAQSAGAMLAALKDSIGSSGQVVINCSQLNFGQCTMDPAIIRLACPVTCGCSLAFEGNFRTSGCPIVWCSALQSFRDGLYIQPTNDIDAEVLPFLPKWNLYWQSVLSYMPTNADAATWRNWDLQGLSKQVLVQNFQRLGCNAFAYFQKSYRSEFKAVYEYFCFENRDTRRPVAIFCPHACDCRTQVQLGVSTFCPRDPPVNLSTYVPPHCPGLRVRNATMLDNSQCKQNFTNNPTISHPEGWYNCSPNAYNGKNVYTFIDSNQLRWEIRWESAAKYGWGAYFLGQRVGLFRTSKWTLSSIDPKITSWTEHTRSCVGRFFNSYSTTLPSDHGWFPRNSSNTDFDCARGDMTTEGAAKYFVQPKNRNNCPTGYDTIFPQYACKNAAAAIGVRYLGSGNVWNYPIGCYVYTDGSNQDFVWHNSHGWGRARTDSGPLCEKVVGASDPPTIPCDFENGMCGWTTSAPYRWFRMSGVTPSANTGPASAHSGSYYMLVEASSPNNPWKGPFVLESPALPQHSPNASRTLSFYYHMYGKNVGQALRVTALGIPSPLWNRTGNHGDYWRPAQVNIPLTAIKIRFEGTTGATWASDIAIDAIAFHFA